MIQESKIEVLFKVYFSRLKIGLMLRRQTWEVHIKPFHPLTDDHLKLIEDIRKDYPDDQPVWYKAHKATRMCIVKGMTTFLPNNRFLLIAFRQYSDEMGCITSVYPIDDLPSSEKGYRVL